MNREYAARGDPAAFFVGEAKQNLPVARKRRLELIFDFCDVEKSSRYRSGYTCGFSTSQKSESNPRSAFASGRGFASFA